MSRLTWRPVRDYGGFRSTAVASHGGGSEVMRGMPVLGSTSLRGTSWGWGGKILPRRPAGRFPRHPEGVQNR